MNPRLQRPGSGYYDRPAQWLHRPGEKTDHAIFLPFEGDNTLSVILSKAFLLVNDAQIKDPSIKSQLVQGSGRES